MRVQHRLVDEFAGFSKIGVYFVPVKSFALFYSCTSFPTILPGVRLELSTPTPTAEFSEPRGCIRKGCERIEYLVLFAIVESFESNGIFQ